MSEGKVLGQTARMAPAAEPDAMETYKPGLTNLPKYTKLQTGEIVPVEKALGRTVARVRQGNGRGYGGSIRHI